METHTYAIIHIATHTHRQQFIHTLTRKQIHTWKLAFIYRVTPMQGNTFTHNRHTNIHANTLIPKFTHTDTPWVISSCFPPPPLPSSSSSFSLFLPLISFVLVSHSPGYPWIHYAVKNGFEFLILLPLPPKVCTILSMALFVLRKHLPLCPLFLRQTHIIYDWDWLDSDATLPECWG